MKLFKRLVSALLIAALFALCIPAFAAEEPEFPEAPDGYDGYISFSVSALTMGWTYLIDPVLIPVNEGETLDVVTERAFDMLDWGYTLKPDMETFYLTGVACYETEPYIADYLMEQFEIYPAWAEENMGMSFGEWTGEYVDDEMLSEYEYSTFSGWMFLENGASGFSGADATPVSVGSDYTWFFTVYGWGMDYGVNDGWGMFPEFDNPMAGVDRTAIHRAIAAISADDELIETAFDIAADELMDLLDAFYDPDSSQEYLDECLEAFLAKLYGSEEYEVGDVDMNGELDTVDVLLIMRHAMEIIDLGEEGAALADFDGNGSVELLDALLLARAIL